MLDRDHRTHWTHRAEPGLCREKFLRWKVGKYDVQSQAGETDGVLEDATDGTAKNIISLVRTILLLSITQYSVQISFMSLNI